MDSELIEQAAKATWDADDDLPFRCGRCGSFVGQQRLYEADDYGPKACQRCKRARRAGQYP